MVTILNCSSGLRVRSIQEFRHSLHFLSSRPWQHTVTVTLHTPHFPFIVFTIRLRLVLELLDGWCLTDVFLKRDVYDNKRGTDSRGGEKIITESILDYHEGVDGMWRLTWSLGLMYNHTPFYVFPLVVVLYTIIKQIQLPHWVIQLQHSQHSLLNYEPPMWPIPSSWLMNKSIHFDRRSATLTTLIFVLKLSKDSTVDLMYRTRRFSKEIKKNFLLHRWKRNHVVKFLLISLVGTGNRPYEK
jgi:hypothetical protein